MLSISNKGIKKPPEKSDGLSKKYFIFAMPIYKLFSSCV